MSKQNSEILPSLLSGLAGATALTLVHQTAKQFIPDAPRMDVVGRRAIARGARSLGREPLHGDKLQAAALVGDIALNSLYYSLVGVGGAKHPFGRGSALGSLAGLGAVVLPPLMKLGRRTRGRTTQGKAMTFSWYLLGGLAAATAFQAMQNRKR